MFIWVRMNDDESFVQYDSAKWEPAFLRQAREFLFFLCYPGSQASEFLFSTEELGPSPRG